MLIHPGLGGHQPGHIIHAKGNDRHIGGAWRCGAQAGEGGFGRGPGERIKMPMHGEVLRQRRHGLTGKGLVLLSHTDPSGRAVTDDGQPQRGAIAGDTAARPRCFRQALGDPADPQRLRDQQGGGGNAKERVPHHQPPQIACSRSQFASEISGSVSLPAIGSPSIRFSVVSPVMSRA